MEDAGVAQLVEHQPSKLRVAGSSLVSRSKFSKFGYIDDSSSVYFCVCLETYLTRGMFAAGQKNAGVAQSVEHQLPKLRVASSSLVSRSEFSRRNYC